MVTKYRVIPFVFNKFKFAQEITYAISVQKITIREIAEAADISPAAVKDLQTGKHANPEMKTWLGVCNALDLDPRNYFQLED